MKSNFLIPIGIVVGHNSASQGAVRKDTNETEYHWNSALARKIEQAAGRFGLEAIIFFRTPGLGYTKEIRRCYAEADAAGVAATVELHFNSAADESATGTETLTSGSPLSMRLAQAVNDEMVRALGLRDRGIKTRSRKTKGRGYQSLIAGDAPAILIEPFFGSSKKGQRATDEGHEQDELAIAILRGIQEAVVTFPRKSLENSRTTAATGRQRSQQKTQAYASVAAAVGTAATAAQDQVAQIPAIGGLSTYLPYVTVGLICVIFFASVLSRRDTDLIEEARIDDHERRFR